MCQTWRIYSYRYMYFCVIFSRQSDLCTRSCTDQRTCNIVSFFGAGGFVGICQGKDRERKKERSNKVFCYILLFICHCFNELWLKQTRLWVGNGCWLPYQINARAFILLQVCTWQFTHFLNRQPAPKFDYCSFRGVTVHKFHSRNIVFL